MCYSEDQCPNSMDLDMLVALLLGLIQISYYALWVQDKSRMTVQLSNTHSPYIPSLSPYRGRDNRPKRDDNPIL